jgi:hypothetical protein
MEHVSAPQTQINKHHLLPTWHSSQPQLGLACHALLLKSMVELLQAVSTMLRFICLS